MNHVPGAEFAATRDYGIPDPNRPFRYRLGLYRFPAFSLDGTSHARAHPEMVVGRIHDGVHFRLGDITLPKNHASTTDALFIHEKNSGWAGLSRGTCQLKTA
jgi:hypothetical protein